MKTNICEYLISLCDIYLGKSCAEGRNSNKQEGAEDYVS